MKKLFLKSMLLAFAGLGLSVQASTTYTMETTCYGWYDNSPPGADIAYPQIHSEAGGVGTYGNPVTFATDSSELAPGTIVYVSHFQRYFIMEDDCVQCDSDWGSGKRHIDLWCGGNPPSSESDAINCEDNLSDGGTSVIVNPPSNESVSIVPMFTSSSSQCYVPGSGSSGGNYVFYNANSGKALDDTGGSTSNGTIMQQWTASNGDANQEWSLYSWGGGWWGILNVHSGLALDDTGGSTSNGTFIQQWAWNSSGSANQEWQFIPNPDGTFQIQNKQSGKDLQIADYGTANGDQATQWSWGNNTSQEWWVFLNGSDQ
jgi:hypothetical protein